MKKKNKRLYLIIMSIILIVFIGIFAKKISNKSLTYDDLPNLYLNHSEKIKKDKLSPEAIEAREILSDILMTEYRKDHPEIIQNNNINTFLNPNTEELRVKILNDYFASLDIVLKNTLSLNEQDKLFMKEVANIDIYNKISSLEGIITPETFNSIQLNLRNILFMKLQVEKIELNKLNALEEEITKQGVEQFKEALNQISE